MATIIRYIETADLPAGYDVGDLIESGITGEALRAWIRPRLRDGVPPAETPAPVAPREPRARPVAQQKAPPSEDSGARGRTLRREGPGATVSLETTQSSVPAVVATDGNVVTIESTPAPDPWDEDRAGLPPEFSDDSLADAFSNVYADRLLYVAPWGRWMFWNRTRWEHDETLVSVDLARKVCRHASNEVLLRTDLGQKARGMAASIASMRTIGNVERLARTDRRHAATPQQWDHDPWLLNTPTGVVDLRTGMLRPPHRDDFCTKTTSVGPGGACPTWLEFLKVATDGDDHLIEFMRRMAGYCLTGVTREHAVFFVYGTGGNGKGTFLNMLQSILHDYARTASMSIFMEQKFATHTTDLAELQGARIVAAQETEEGKRWNEERLKSMSGGDPITARFMRENNFTYTPQFKLVFSGNHKPDLRTVDAAIRRRMHMIPFTVTIPPEKRDVNLPKKLEAEAAGILQWMIEGCLDWERNMLAPPARVTEATEEYFTQQDGLGQFFDECCEFDGRSRVKTGDLYQRYSRWSEARGEYVLPQRRWLAQLSTRAMHSRKVGGVMVIEGVRLKSIIDAAGPGMPEF